MPKPTDPAAQEPAASPEPSKPNPTAFECVALLLQGGGALGAYQAGVYEALREAAVEPTWIAGISIGAINSAIIAGNAPERRVEKLRAFWELASESGAAGWDFWMGSLQAGVARGWANQLAALGVMATGVPGFFTPRSPPPFLRADGAPGATSWYDTAVLKTTLERLTDFDRINAGPVRLSVGAVDVKSGNFAYFDTETTRIRPEHVMASGALPPAFPPVEIDGRFYWDGGLVTNTPLDWVLSSRSDLDSLVFQVDLWSAEGRLPQDLTDVASRMKEIQYSSRTRAATDAFRRQQKLRSLFNELLEKLPADLRDSPEARVLAAAADPAAYNIVHLIYRSAEYEGQSKDYEFSRRTMEEHWAAGLRDARRTLAHPQVLQRPAGGHTVNVFDFTRAGG